MAIDADVEKRKYKQYARELLLSICICYYVVNQKFLTLNLRNFMYVVKQHL